MAITYPTSLDTFTTKLDNVDDVEAVDINDVQDAVEALEIKVGIDGSADTDSLDYITSSYNDRKLWIYENTAPAGWNIVSGTTDAVLGCKGGTDDFDDTGGTQVGTWTNGAHGHADTLAAPAHTHNRNAHAHSVNSGSWGRRTYGDLDYCLAAVDYTALHAINGTTGTDGSGTTSGASATALSGGVTSYAGQSAWRPLANLGIVIEKT